MADIIGRIAGLVEIEDAPNGLVEMKAKDHMGARMGFFQVADWAMDDQLIDDIMAWRARHALQGSLSIVRPSASTA